MIDINDVIKEVSKRTGIDIETVSAICKHPFVMTVEYMKDESEYKDILFNGLFKFKLKKRYRQDKTKPYKVQ